MGVCLSIHRRHHRDQYNSDPNNNDNNTNANNNQDLGSDDEEFNEDNNNNNNNTSRTPSRGGGGLNVHIVYPDILVHTVAAYELDFDHSVALILPLGEVTDEQLLAEFAERQLSITEYRKMFHFYLSASSNTASSSSSSSSSSSTSFSTNINPVSSKSNHMNSSNHINSINTTTHVNTILNMSIPSSTSTSTPSSSSTTTPTTLSATQQQQQQDLEALLFSHSSLSMSLPLTTTTNTQLYTEIFRRQLDLHETVNESLVSQRYDIGKMLGHGASGKVFSCMQRSSHEVFAMKVIMKNATMNDAQSMGTEIEIMKRVRHECVLKMVELYQNTVTEK